MEITHGAGVDRIHDDFGFVGIRNLVKKLRGGLRQHLRAEGLPDLLGAPRPAISSSNRTWRYV